MRHRTSAAFIGLVLAAAVATPVAAARPDQSTEVIEGDWLQAECGDGDVIWQHNVITLKVSDFFDRAGDVVREVTHADTVGISERVHPDGSSVQVATYRDRGGTFTHRGDDFIWTGIVDLYVTRDGSRYANTGRQVFHVTSWDPFEADWTMDGGRNDEWDPCTW
jgi:hypothetical protein